MDTVPDVVSGRCAGYGDYGSAGFYPAAAYGFFAILQREQIARTLLILTVPAIATVLVFTHDKDPLIFFIFPALLLVVFQLGFPGAALTVFVIALFSIGLTR